MKLTPLILSMVALSGIALGVITFYGDAITTYNPSNSTLTSEFDTFNRTFEDYTKKMGQIENKTVGAATKDWTDWTRYYDATMAFLGVGGIILDMPNLMISFINTAGGLIPAIPTWFKLMVATIITIIFALRVAAIFTKTDEI